MGSPLPPGFTIDAPASSAPGAAAPPPPDGGLPPGFKLDPLPIPQLPAEPGMSWGDWARFAMTAGVRGVARASDELPDPLSTVRRLVAPQFQPANWLGTQLFNATGVPEYQPTTPAGRIGMETATGAVSGGATGLIPGAIQGALGGFAGQEVKEQGGSDRLAGLASMVPSLVAGGLGFRARSRTTPELDAAGVNPTIGQALGGPINRIEQAIGSLPWFGDFIRSGRAGAIEQFNTGGINTKALNPIGESLAPTTEMGHAAINEMRTKVGTAYDNLESQLGPMSLDPTFASGLTSIVKNMGMLSAEHGRLFNTLFKNNITDPLNQSGGTLSPKQFRDAESTLGQEGTSNLSSPSPADRTYGNLVMDLRDQLRQQLKRSNPDQAEALQNIHDAYSYAERFAQASTRRGTGLQGQSEPGVFTPGQLESASMQMDPTLRHHAFAEGNAILQKYAQAGRRLLGDTVPDSGTPFRSLVAWLGTGGGLGGGATALGLLNPATLLPIGAGALGAGLLYSPTGRAAMNYFLRRPEQAMAPGLLNEGR